MSFSSSSHGYYYWYYYYTSVIILCQVYYYYYCCCDYYYYHHHHLLSDYNALAMTITTPYSYCNLHDFRLKNFGCPVCVHLKMYKIYPPSYDKSYCYCYFDYYKHYIKIIKVVTTATPTITMYLCTILPACNEHMECTCVHIFVVSLNSWCNKEPFQSLVFSFLLSFILGIFFFFAFVLSAVGVWVV